MGPSVKFVSAIKDAIFNKKNGGKFLFLKKCQTGGVRGGFGKRPDFFLTFFVQPSLSELASRYCLHFLKRKQQKVPQNCSFEEIFGEKSAEKQLCRLLEREADRESWRWLVFLKIDENFNLNGWNKTVVACL